MALYLRGNVWWIKYKVNGVPVRERTKIKGRAHKAAARIVEAAVLADAAMRTAGKDTHRKTRETSLADLVKEYKAELLRRGGTEAHARQTAHRISRLVEGVDRIEELTPERIRNALARVQGEGDTRELTPLERSTKLSPKTANDFRASLAGMFAWLVKEERWDRNPVVCVRRVENPGPAKPRVALTADQLGKLLASDIPLARRACYLVAATTGLRRSELRSLRWGQLNLVAGTVALAARSAKNRRAATLPLREDAVEALKTIRGEAEADDPVFPTTPETRTFYNDLVGAGVLESIAAHETADGVLDFHGLRVTFATSLARADVPLALAQKLMRHSTPVLTANIYTKLEMHDGRAAVDKIDVGATPKAPTVEAPRATESPAKTPKGGHKRGHSGNDSAPKAGALKTLELTPTGFEPVSRP